jgi:hypothetical protein
MKKNEILQNTLEALEKNRKLLSILQRKKENLESQIENLEHKIQNQERVIGR